MENNYNPNQTNHIEERWTSPSDRIKEMILRRWDRTENAYAEGEDTFFIRSTRSLMRNLGIFIDDEDTKRLEDLDKKEEKDIEAVNNNKDIKSDELKAKKIKDIEFKYALLKMDMAAQLINNSAIITKDLEVDFRIPTNPKEVEKLQDIITEKTPIQETPMKFR